MAQLSIATKKDNVGDTLNAEEINAIVIEHNETDSRVEALEQGGGNGPVSRDTVSITLFDEFGEIDIISGGRRMYVSASRGANVPGEEFGSGVLTNGAQSIWVEGTKAYVGDQTNNTIHVFDISTPTSPVHLSGEDIVDATNLNTPNSIQVVGTKVYALNTAGNPDISTPTSPSVDETRCFDRPYGRIPSGTNAMFIANNKIYNGGSDRYEVYDITNAP